MNYLCCHLIFISRDFYKIQGFLRKEMSIYYWPSCSEKLWLLAYLSTYVLRVKIISSQDGSVDKYGTQILPQPYQNHN